ncbi:C40 family peptidase [Streptomyces actinomycinicus]|uniref:C40 family peptidase n=1 Tax=Streptomyces actinomycinicus TaxID=1695166 RepID=A0A937EFM0_9ACTN|nr:C40 family peptidase [Streptomyces actinomycinicus]
MARRAARARGIPAQRGTAPARDTAATPPARGVDAVPSRRTATVPSSVQRAARPAPGEHTAATAAADGAPEVAARDPKVAKAAVQRKLAHARVLLSRRIGQEAARPVAPVTSRVSSGHVAPVTSVPMVTTAASTVTAVASTVTAVAPTVTAVAPTVTTAASGAAPAPVAPGTDATTKALKALAFAREQLGKPCVWGAAGPGSYDCSGLTQAAWKSAGVTLPRTARDQAEAGTTVPYAEARPGDLVFFHDDAGHVGLCSGDGMMIHAPRPGAYVREEPVSYGDGSAVRRVVRPG